MHPRDFLIALWGESPPGVVQLWAAARRETLYLQSISELPELQWGAMTDIYTSVTTAPSVLGRHTRAKAAQAAGVCGMWLDIDVEEGKAADMNTAIQLSMSFAEPTIVVSSGGGIHAWYLLKNPVAIPDQVFREKVAVLADAWNRAHNERAREQGFRIDRTQDLARLLRVPGTLNGKSEPHRAVGAVMQDGPRYTLNQLAGMVDTHVRQAQIAMARRSTSVARGGTSATFSLEAEPVVPNEKFTALMQWYPDFASTWLRKRRMKDNSQSSYDMTLAIYTAQVGDWTDQEIVDLLRVHRAHSNPGDPKLSRVDYYEKTLASSRSTAERNRTQQDHDNRVSQIQGLLKGN